MVTEWLKCFHLHTHTKLYIHVYAYTIQGGLYSHVTSQVARGYRYDQGNTNPSPALKRVPRRLLAIVHFQAFNVTYWKDLSAGGPVEYAGYRLEEGIVSSYIAKFQRQHLYPFLLKCSLRARRCFPMPQWVAPIISLSGNECWNWLTWSTELVLVGGGW